MNKGVVRGGQNALERNGHILRSCNIWEIGNWSCHFLHSILISWPLPLWLSTWLLIYNIFFMFWRKTWHTSIQSMPKQGCKKNEITLQTKVFSIVVQIITVNIWLREPSSYPQSPQKFIKQHFFATGPCLFLPNHLFCLFHCKAHWTMSVDNVGLQICLLGAFTVGVLLLDV